MEATITKSERETLKAIYRLAKDRGGATPATWPSRSASPREPSRPPSSAWPIGASLDHKPYRGVELTTPGRRAAVAAIRRHRIVERFLADMLGYAWNEADRLATSFEHELPQEVEDRLFVALDRPATCPHGFPIPEPEAAEIPRCRRSTPRARRHRGRRGPRLDRPRGRRLPRHARAAPGRASRSREAPVRRPPGAAGRRPGPHPGREGRHQIFVQEGDSRHERCTFSPPRAATKRSTRWYRVVLAVLLGRSPPCSRSSSASRSMRGVLAADDGTPR